MLLTVSSPERPTNFESDSNLGYSPNRGALLPTRRREWSDTDIERTLATLERIRRLRERMKLGEGALMAVRQGREDLNRRTR
jgi:hypothetical protein